MQHQSFINHHSMSSDSSQETLQTRLLFRGRGLITPVATMVVMMGARFLLLAIAIAMTARALRLAFSSFLRLVRLRFIVTPTTSLLLVSSRVFFAPGVGSTGSLLLVRGPLMVPAAVTAAVALGCRGPTGPFRCRGCGLGRRL